MGARDALRNLAGLIFSIKSGEPPCHLCGRTCSHLHDVPLPEQGCVAPHVLDAYVGARYDGNSLALEDIAGHLGICRTCACACSEARDRIK